MILDLYARWRRAKTPGSRNTFLRRICQLLSLHTEREERFLYPEANVRLSRVDDMIIDALQDHDQAKILILALLEMAPNDDRRDDTLVELMADMTKHVQSEEAELFPRIRESITKRELLHMAQQMRTVG